MINTKLFFFIMPFFIISMIIYQLYSEEKKIARNAHPSEVNRQIASGNIINNLSFSFRKINHLQNNEKNGIENNVYVSEEEKMAIDDLNYLKSNYFFAHKNIDRTSFQQRYNSIQLRINQNPKVYNVVINFELEDSLLTNDNKSSSQLFALAASLQLGPSSLQNSAEKILIDLTSMDREWDEELFKNALQFYYVQNLIKNEKNDTLIENFIKKCPDKKLRNKILQIDKEINIYSKNVETDRGIEK